MSICNFKEVISESSFMPFNLASKVLRNLAAQAHLTAIRSLDGKFFKTCDDGPLNPNNLSAPIWKTESSATHQHDKEESTLHKLAARNEGWADSNANHCKTGKLVSV
jgi:hypothetical protein